VSELPILFLVPRAGALIPIPGERRMLAATGERVRVDRYWQRRLAEGDVAESAQPSEPAPALVPET
jgi:hypothetical protein